MFEIWGTVCTKQTVKQVWVWVRKSIDGIEIGLATHGLEKIRGTFISLWELLFSSALSKAICCPPEVQLILRAAARLYALHLAHQDQIWAV